MCLMRTNLRPARKAPPRRSSARRRGFTLVELLIAMGVIFVLAAIAIPSFLGALNNARIARCVGDVRTIGNEVNAIGFMTGTYPTYLTETTYNDLTDPWGNDYVYKNLRIPANAGHGRTDRFNVQVNSNFDLYSMGPDKDTADSLVSSTSRDDVVWANEGAYIGLAGLF